MYEDPKSKISQLEKVLNAREDRVSGRTKRHELSDRENTVRQDWDGDEFKVGTEISNSSKGQGSDFSVERKRISLPLKILIGSVLFFVIALLAVFFKFFGGTNIVSGSNIDITVKAPISIAGGETLPFEIDIKNNNSITLSGADLGITYPTGAQDAANPSLPAKRAQIYLGDILPGQSLNKNLSIILLGTANEQKDINIVLEYKVTGSNSLFNKTKTFSVLISSTPVDLVVTAPSEANTNQSVDFSVDITSNSPSLMKNVLLKVDYPFGFSFSSSDPKTYAGNNLWLLGDLAPGDKRTIKFSGVLSGQEGEARGFNFSLGSQSQSNLSAIDVPFTTSFSSVTIRRPFVSADISLNGTNDPEYISRAGAKVEAIIKWQNNLPYEVSDVSIGVKLSGNSLDKSSVQVDSGFYQSINNIITFDKTTDPTFAVLQPGQTGTSQFTFNSFGASTVTGAGLTNPTITLNLSVKGTQVNYQGSGTSGDVLFSDSRQVKITANPQLSAKALYYIGPFQNNGPIPPKAEQETSYTITWTITNPLNNLSGAQVSATLPIYMKWLGVISPAQEKVNYDPSTGLVTWNVGNISAGAGMVLPAREVSFQASLLPSVSQIGTVPSLIGEAVLNAKDNFTLTPVSDSFPTLDTRLISDPYFKVDNETVVQ